MNREVLWYECRVVLLFPLTYLEKTMWRNSELHQIYCACYLWSWLCLPVAALRYVLYFHFVDDAVFSHNRPCDMLSAFLSDNSKKAASIPTKFCSQIAISKYWLRVSHYWAKSAINDCHVYWYATVRVVHGAVLGSERVVREASSSTARARCLQFRMTVSLRRHWNVSGTEPASRWWSKISGLASTVLHQCSSSSTAVDTET